MVCNLCSQLPPHSETAGECSLWDEEVLRYNVIFRLGEFEGFLPHPHEPKGSLLKSALWKLHQFILNWDLCHFRRWASLAKCFEERQGYEWHIWK